MIQTTITFSLIMFVFKIFLMERYPEWHLKQFLIRTISDNINALLLVPFLKEFQAPRAITNIILPTNAQMLM